MLLNGGKYQLPTKTSLDQIMMPQKAILLCDIVRQPVPFVRQSCIRVSLFHDERFSAMYAW